MRQILNIGSVKVKKSLRALASLSGGWLRAKIYKNLFNTAAVSSLRNVSIVGSAGVLPGLASLAFEGDKAASAGVELNQQVLH